LGVGDRFVAVVDEDQAARVRIAGVARKRPVFGEDAAVITSAPYDATSSALLR